MRQDDDISLTFLKHPAVWSVTIARLLIALFIFANPLWGLILSVIADWIDKHILMFTTGITLSQYQLWDKNVDWFAYVVELSVATTYGLYLPFFLLLFWRFIGQFMFLRTHKRWIFILFPNYFEVAFLWLVVFHQRKFTIDISTDPASFWLVVLLVAKQIHEIYLHYILPTYKLDELFFMSR
ncbi:hypothetical protein HY032_01990 [Candidatus Gottesmanbacteria bacterium]|nr:hypothetical protein [Candidatus Gottesmanbacteria bacterium]